MATIPHLGQVQKQSLPQFGRELFKIPKPESGVRRFFRKTGNVLWSTPARIFSYLNPRNYIRGFQAVRQFHREHTRNQLIGEYALGILDVANIFLSMGLVIPLMILYPKPFIACGPVQAFFRGLQERPLERWLEKRNLTWDDF